MIYLGRRITISMAHRLNNPHLSEAQNRALYGKCNNPNGHGHEYVVEATCGGEIDPVTGFSVDLGAIDAALRREIFERFDHRDFDADFPELAHVISSGENLAKVFWDLLAPHVPEGATLARVRVEETEKNSFEYFGGRAAIDAPAHRHNEESAS